MHSSRAISNAAAATACFAGCLFSLCKLADVSDQVFDVRIAQFPTVGRHFVLALSGDRDKVGITRLLHFGRREIMGPHLFAGGSITLAVGSLAHGALRLVVGSCIRRGWSAPQCQPDCQCCQKQTANHSDPHHHAFSFGQKSKNDTPVLLPDSVLCKKVGQPPRTNILPLRCRLRRRMGRTGWAFPTVHSYNRAPPFPDRKSTRLNSSH